MKVSTLDKKAFSLEAECAADHALLDALHSAQMAHVVTLKHSPADPRHGGRELVGVTLSVDRSSPHALRDHAAREALGALRQLFSLGLGQATQHGHAGFAPANQSTDHGAASQRTMATIAALPQDLARTLQRAASRLDLDVDGLSVAEIVERYTALGCQIAPQLAARLQVELGATRAGHREIAIRELNDELLTVSSNENDGPFGHSSSVSGTGPQGDDA